MRAEVVTDAPALAALEPDWWELFARCPDATPFRSPAWLLPWWDAFAPGRLATVAVWAGERLAALAPAYVEAGALGRRLLPLGIGVSDDLDLLLPADDARPSAAALLTETLSGLADIDAWELEQLGPEASAWTLPLPGGLVETVADQDACPVLALLDGDGLGAVPARQRRKLRMAQHRVARRGGEVVLAADPLGFLDDLLRLHAGRWESRGEGGVLRSEPVQAFHRAALPRLAAAGLADLFTLRIEDRTVGVHYGLRRPGRAFAYLGGFDPAFAFESPGTVLMGHAIAQAARRGDREMNLLRGREPYKYAWGAVDRPNRRRSWRRAAAG